MTAERYRRLPGRRRGILGGASVWLGSDHLLAVRSMRFRENYRRFYLRDVQAIAVARKPRFHLSMRSLAIAVTMFWTYLFLRSLWDWADVAFWSLAFCLAAAWAVVSATFSCTCRIYTAVSREELPSIYRTWTARRFLAKVEPLITQAQGTIEGQWTELAEPKGVGPSPTLPPLVDAVETAQPASASTSPFATPAPAQPMNRSVSYFFIATLLADAGFSAATLHSQSRAVFWVQLGLMMARVVAAILIFVQRYRRRVRAGMQTLAIVSLALTGIVSYIQQVSAQLSASGSLLAPGGSSIWNRPPALAQFDIAVNVVLAVIGLAMVLGSDS